MKVQNEIGLIQQKSLTPIALFHLLVIWTVWGSTYLAIRLAVQEGSGFPPFTMGAMRILSAGIILLFFCFWKYRKICLSSSEFIRIAFSGVLIWNGGHGLVIWAEQRVDSGLAAVIFASMPIWVAILESVLNKQLPSRLLILSLIAGFTGVTILTIPILLTGIKADLLSVAGLIFSTISWAAGSVFQSRNPVSLPTVLVSGYQQLLGGIVFIIMAILFQEPSPTPTNEAWLAWGYLVIFGSIIAYTSFVFAIRLLPTNIAMTYAYVNPVVATILGWFILNEQITIWTIWGTIFVLFGVAGVFRFQGSK